MIHYDLSLGPFVLPTNLVPVPPHSGARRLQILKRTEWPGDRGRRNLSSELWIGGIYFSRKRVL